VVVEMDTRSQDAELLLHDVQLAATGDWRDLAACERLAAVPDSFQVA
jgi:hypothetical protein